ncbi:MAG: translation initiation factor IF-2 [Bdellovibrionales bacterium GWB1_52_6]|nr:MAG: translation initiation factor IF-2 [Bdellovibrionales bacterium GWB1_52_6]OFZ03133.1 MAG: translation initiation factor IF-2 [Bdellovibrionales bacterium GWA1_52_35]
MTVFELARELGKQALALVDELKTLNINVKNHMSELTPEQVQVARSSFGKKSGELVKPAKKPVARTRKKAAETPQALAVQAALAEADKKAAAPILRRRLKADGGTETVTTATPSSKAAHEAISAHDMPEAAIATKEAIADALREAAAQVEADEATQLLQQEAEQHQPAAPEAVEEPAPSESEQTELETAAPAATTSPAAPAPTVHAPHAAATTKAAAPTAAQTPATPPTTSTTAPAKPARPPIVLTPRPVAPRRSILKIVEPQVMTPKIIKAAPPASPVKPAMKGTATQDREGFRIIKMTKENLDQMVEEEAAKKRGGGREAEIRPEDVRFADYRKKEMVFLPKKKKIPVGKEIRKTQLTQAKAQKRIVEMKDTISIHDLANQLSVKAVDVVRKLMGMGQMVTLNQSVDFDTATLVGAEYQYEVRNVAYKEEQVLADNQDTPEDLLPRPPVVTIMGHVDHGKTTLLDAIREENVAGGEAGGITQHIGAYTVNKNGKMITFIDTPGHEAFSVMRARGANVTDIVILVVSADDGVMPQTREALSHAQAAKVPIIVAVNKIDKPGANPEKIKQGLAELNLLAEDWGGETMFIPVSALKKTNIDKLLDGILLQAEMLDLKANANVRAIGTVLEARLEKGRGPVVSLLVNRGTLRVGEPIVSGPYAGRVKALTNDKGANVKEAGPGYAVEVLGFEGIPSAGETFHAAATDADARDIAQNRVDKNRERSAVATGKMSLEELFAKIQSGDMKELSVILKGDVFGSVEAIRESLLKIESEKVKVKVIHSAPGGITESDVLLATASNAIIIGFNVRPETKARQLAEAEHVEIKCYNIIYELIDDVKAAMTGLLEKKKIEKFLGRAEVRQIFSVPKIGVIAGSSVIDGKIIRGANVRLLRESRIIFEGKMSSLRRFKDDTKEVATGFECGIGIENYQDLKPGDIIEAYQIDLIAPTLNA